MPYSGKHWRKNAEKSWNKKHRCRNPHCSKPTHGAQNVKGLSPLARLKDFDLVRDMCPDYMHLSQNIVKDVFDLCKFGGVKPKKGENKKEQEKDSSATPGKVSKPRGSPTSRAYAESTEEESKEAEDDPVVGHDEEPEEEESEEEEEEERDNGDPRAVEDEERTHQLENSSYEEEEEEEEKEEYPPTAAAPPTKPAVGDAQRWHLSKAEQDRSDALFKMLMGPTEVIAHSRPPFSRLGNLTAYDLLNLLRTTGCTRSVRVTLSRCVGQRSSPSSTTSSASSPWPPRTSSPTM